MGILSDPTQSEKLSNAVLKYHNILSVFCYIIGILWFVLLAHKPYNAGTYFSENALLPGLVESEYHSDSDAKRYLQLINDESERYKKDLPFPWLSAQFLQLGLETFSHNFSLHHPLKKNVTYSGNNFYAILRAKRTANTEALVIATPYRSTISVLPGTSPSIAIMLSLAKFLRKQTYLAKDIIFLITQHEQLGAQAWLEAYHQSSSASQALESGNLVARAGSIQAALNLEIHSDSIGYMDLKVEGLNGQLPNLDLFNLAVRLCSREQVMPTIKNMMDHRRPETPEGWLHSFKAMISMMSSQATGVPTGNHGLFLRYNIEALTLEGHAHRKGMVLPYRKVGSLLNVGRILEGILRSLNNLQERFHQSFFLYLLPATDRYVSIGMYMPAFGLIVLPMALKALGLRVQLNQANEENERLKKQKSGKSKSGLPKIETYLSFLSAFPCIILVHCIGILILLSPPYLSHFGSNYGFSSEESLVYGLITIFVGSLSLPIFLFRGLLPYQSVSWKVLKCTALLELATFLASISLINISLATFISLIYTPFVCFITPSASRWKTIFKSVLVLLLCPIAFGFAVTILDTVVSDGEFIRIDSLFKESAIAYKRALMYSVVDEFVYGNWLFGAACGVLFPVWLLLWCAIHSSII